MFKLVTQIHCTGQEKLLGLKLTSVWAVDNWKADFVKCDHTLILLLYNSSMSHKLILTNLHFAHNIAVEIIPNKVKAKSII